MAKIVEFENRWGDEQQGQTGRDSAVATTALGRCELLLPHHRLGCTQYFDMRVLPEQIDTVGVSKWAIRLSATIKHPLSYYCSRYTVLTISRLGPPLRKLGKPWQ